MKENQETIDEWGRTTFGLHHALTHATRMNIEVAELLSQLGTASSEDLVLDRLLRLNIEVAELLSQRANLLQDENRLTTPQVDGKECADVLVVLYQVAAALGADLHAEVDAKMQVNRARTWSKTEDGRYQHVS